MYSHYIGLGAISTRRALVALDRIEDANVHLVAERVHDIVLHLDAAVVSMRHNGRGRHEHTSAGIATGAMDNAAADEHRDLVVSSFWCARYDKVAASQPLSRLCYNGNAFRSCDQELASKVAAHAPPSGLYVSGHWQQWTTLKLRCFCIMFDKKQCLQIPYGMRK
ncbi:hypothetical protein ON010_g1550 [Phytophthora cinnamomi]|nr:hypothetical protein ON010_g1550 [Phytophthora cinnamomi]